MSANRSPHVVLGVDLGATKILGGAFDEQMQLLGTERLPSGADAGPEHVIGGLLAVLRRLRDTYGRPDFIGVGAAGQIEWPSGRVLSSGGSIPGWAGTHIGEIVSSEFGCPVRVDNDANVAALGEYVAGAAAGAKCVVCFTLGTGIGVGVVMCGRVFRGAHGVAAELGHATVDMHGPQCSCGRLGCLEAYASGSGIVARYRDATGKAVRDAGTVFSAAAIGDIAAKQVIQKAVHALAEGMANATMAYDPDVIVVSGGLAARWDELVAPAAERMRIHGLRANLDSVRVVRATLIDKAGMYGAALLGGAGSRPPEADCVHSGGSSGQMSRETQVT